MLSYFASSICSLLLRSYLTFLSCCHCQSTSREFLSRESAKSLAQWNLGFVLASTFCFSLKLVSSFGALRYPWGSRSLECPTESCCSPHYYFTHSPGWLQGQYCELRLDLSGDSSSWILTVAWFWALSSFLDLPLYSLKLLDYNCALNSAAWIASFECWT